MTSIVIFQQPVNCPPCLCLRKSFLDSIVGLDIELRKLLFQVIDYYNPLAPDIFQAVYFFFQMIDSLIFLYLSAHQRQE